MKIDNMFEELLNDFHKEKFTFETDVIEKNRRVVKLKKYTLHLTLILTNIIMNLIYNISNSI